MKIFKNIINFLKKIYAPQKMLIAGISEIDKSSKSENTFIESIQKESKEYLNKKNILEEINNNPSLIDTLPYSRLVQLNSLYEERINEITRIISQKS